MVFRDRPNSRAACRMLMPSTCTARLTRAYTSTWYTSWCPTKHKRPVMFWNRSGVVYFSTATNRRLRGALWSIIALPFREHNGPVYVDLEGRTWLAPAQGGLYVLQNGRVQPVTSIPPNEVVYSISGRADVVWVGRQRGGLTRLRLRNGAIASQSYTEANGLVQT